MPKKLTSKCSKNLNEYMFREMNRHEGYPRNQRIDVPRMGEFTKNIRPPLETEEFYTNDDEQVNLVTTAPRDEHEKQTNTAYLYKPQS